MISLSLTGISDPRIREALKALQDEVNSHQLLSAGFKHFEFRITGAVTNYELTHNLGFIPQDIIVTKETSTGYTWKYDLFTSEKLYITTTGPVTLRCFIGRVI